MAPPVNTWIRKYGPGHKQMIHSIFHVQSLPGYFNISARFLRIQNVRIAIDLSRNQERHKTSMGFRMTICFAICAGYGFANYEFFQLMFIYMYWHRSILYDRLTWKIWRRYKIRLIFTDIYAEIYQINSLKTKSSYHSILFKTTSNAKFEKIICKC
jgi:hypothetical protein